MGNCDSFLYLDGKEYETLEYITRLFKRTETNATKKEKSKKEDAIHPQNIEDFFTLDPSMCVLFVRGVNPFMDKKFICENHKNFI